MIFRAFPRRIFQKLTPITHRSQSTFVSTLKENQIPIWGGLTVVGIFHYFRLRRQQEKEFNELVASGKLEKINADVSWKISFYNSLPLDALSRFVGDLSKKEIPIFARNTIFGAYCNFYGVNIEEAVESDISKYRTLSEFFRRKLKPGVRPIDVQSELVAPCDGKVLHCGAIGDENQVEQVKGMTYKLSEFLGTSNIPVKSEVFLDRYLSYVFLAYSTFILLFFRTAYIK